jgi:protein-L-isoaspartate(D-aspartate) O-methyltransferase
VIYSGTVAAAMEGRCLGLPAVAVSLVLPSTRRALRKRRARRGGTARAPGSAIRCRADTILNVNVPDLPWEQIRGWRVCRLGNRHRAEPCIRERSARPADLVDRRRRSGAGRRPGTDFHAVHEGCIALTPIHVDLTRYQALETVASWAEGLLAPGRRHDDRRSRHGKTEVQGTGMTSQRARDRLVERLRAEGIKDERVLRALRRCRATCSSTRRWPRAPTRTPRCRSATARPISQPWVVARMTEALIEHGMPKKVLEIGTGSGYQAGGAGDARHRGVHGRAHRRAAAPGAPPFRNMGLNLRTKHDDGRLGWPEHAPFDAIIVTAAGAALDGALLDQLAEAARWSRRSAPANAAQALVRIRKTPEGRAARKPRRGGVRAAAAQGRHEEISSRCTTGAGLGLLTSGRPGAGAAQFCEAIFFPVPPEFMLLPMCIASRSAGFHYAAISLAGSGGHVHRLRDRLLRDGRGVAAARQARLRRGVSHIRETVANGSHAQAFLAPGAARLHPGALQDFHHRFRRGGHASDALSSSAP